MESEHQLPLENDLFDGRYKPIRLLGKGGMGKVYLVADTMLDNEEVALKVLKKSLGEEEVHTTRFLREVKVARQITHKNVVRTFDVGTSGDYLYFTMECISGFTLSERLKQEDFIPYEEVAKIIVRLCEGLHAIHALDVIHRDLKPANILITDNDVIKITDFGIARPGTSDLTHGDEIIGSSHFIAPEIWVGKELSSATDMYAVGVVMFEMLCGCVPFTAENPAELMWKHLEQKPVAPSSIEPSVPKWMDELVLALLAKDDRERPCNALEIADYIKKCCAKEEIAGIRDQFLTPEEPAAYEMVEESVNNDFLTNIPCIEDPLPEFVEAENNRSTGTHGTQTHIVDPQEVRARIRDSRPDVDPKKHSLINRSLRSTSRAAIGVLCAFVASTLLIILGPLLVKTIALSIIAASEDKELYIAILYSGYFSILCACLITPLITLHYQMRNHLGVSAHFASGFGVFLGCIALLFSSYWFSHANINQFMKVRIEWIIALGALSPEALYYGFSSSGEVIERCVYAVSLLYYSHHLFCAVMPLSFMAREGKSFTMQFSKSLALLCVIGLLTTLVCTLLGITSSHTIMVNVGMLKVTFKKVYLVSAGISWSLLVVAASYTAAVLELREAKRRAAL